MKTQSRQRFDRPEDREANDDEADECIDEQAQVEGRRASVLRIGQVSVVLAVEREENVGEVHTAHQESENWVDHVFH